MEFAFREKLKRTRAGILNVPGSFEESKRGGDTATHSLLRNEAHKAAKGSDNARIPVLHALSDAGVQVTVCGAALINRKLPPSDRLPFVNVAPTTTHALATLTHRGMDSDALSSA